MLNNNGERQLASSTDDYHLFTETLITGYKKNTTIVKLKKLSMNYSNS
ncbi:hypothetical protein NF867_08900 [Solitalea sp. MAHUQ-68]|uniref:Uncharacterized protein n=1 Tax=Solitalea agri TaxID=2953739 RepID=A0A9X2F9M3_9SPHI|nr:hypothetical protein [Solitalea agri]MCO4292978.1 hypothetical protein [Solitalea agri]